LRVTQAFIPLSKLPRYTKHYSTPIGIESTNPATIKLFSISVTRIHPGATAPAITEYSDNIKTPIIILSELISYLDGCR
jgi:hypothetical protein